jgi:FG-GAP-like repeat
MGHVKLVILFLCFGLGLNAQTSLYRDTIPVIESGSQLKSPWAGGINFSSFSQVDLNQDGKKDLVTYDKVCGSGGKLKTFLNIGNSGEAKYKHAPGYQNQFPAVTEWALLFDYNNDGKNDLFTLQEE